MKKFQPAFEVTQVGSMQWNRTTPGAIAEASDLDQDVHISAEVLKKVRDSIKAQMPKVK